MSIPWSGPCPLCIKSLLYDQCSHHDGIRQLLAGVPLRFDDQLPAVALRNVFYERQLSKDISGLLFYKLWPSIPMISASILDEMRPRCVFIVMNVGWAGKWPRLGDEDVGSTEILAASFWLGDNGTMFVSTMNFELRVIDDIAVIEDFLRRVSRILRLVSTCVSAFLQNRFNQSP